MKRRNFIAGLFAGPALLATPSSFATIANSLPSAKPFPVNANNAIKVRIGNSNNLIKVSIGKGYECETIQDFFNTLPMDLTSSNARYVGEIYLPC